jgi:hypothetical protein
MIAVYELWMIETGFIEGKKGCQVNKEGNISRYIFDI